MQRVKSEGTRSDLIGVILSMACLIHCLALPMFTSVVPSLTIFLGQEWIHATLLVILVPIALLAFKQGHKRHNRLTPMILAILGVIGLIAATFFEGHEEASVEKLLTVMGSLILIFAHVQNLRFINRQMRRSR